MTNALSQGVRALEFYDELIRKLNKNRGVIHITGCLDTQKMNLAAGISDGKRNTLIISPTELKAKALYEDMKLYDPDVFYYPARDMIFYHVDAAGNLLTRERLAVIRALMERKNVTVVTCVRGCMDRLLPFGVYGHNTLMLGIGDELDFTDFSKYENPIAVEWTDGKYISSQGEIGTDANYSISSEIKMRKGQRIVFNATGGSATSILTKFVNGVPTRIFDGSIAVMRYTIPKKFWIADEDCVVRICHDIRANSSNRIIQNEDVKPTIYNDIQYLGNSPLWGKKLVVVGDSLVYGSRIGEYPTWANWLAAKYRMTLVNAGINGSSIAEIPEGADGDDLHDPIVDRYNALLQDNKDADYIVYEGGANDRTQGVPLGSVGSNAKTEFIGAITRIINGTRIIVPKAKIFFISLPWRWTSANTLGLTEADYANAMISACQAKGVLCRNPCFEVDVDFRDAAMAAWADEGIWLGETANRHYSPDGYQYILPAIEKFLNQ